MYLLLLHTFEHMLTVVLSSPSAVNVSLGSTATFTGNVQEALFLNWFINGSLNAEHNPFNGVQWVLSQNSTVMAKELQLKATLLLNHSEVSCLTGSIHSQLVHSSRVRLLAQGTSIQWSWLISTFKFVGSRVRLLVQGTSIQWSWLISTFNFVGLCVCVLTAGLLAGVGDLVAVNILSSPSVFLSWTPYTLDNVPITGYNVTTTECIVEGHSLHLQWG